MNEDRIVGYGKEARPKAQEGLERVAGDTKTQAEGIVIRSPGRHRICTGKLETAR